MSDAPCLLMTGGTGFVGRYLAPRLVSLFPNHRRVMIVRSTANGSEDADWERMPVDLGSEAGLIDLVGQLQPVVVVHLAAQSSVGEARQAAEATWRINVVATFNLALALARVAPANQAELVFFTSTGEVYGSSLLAGAATENTHPAPTNAYALSKLAAEQVLQDLLPPRTRLIVTRAFNHSGAGHDERFVLPSFAAQIVRAEGESGKATISVGNLAAERDFLHVSDVIDAYIALIEIAGQLPMRTVVNVASGTPWRLESLLAALLAKAKRPVTVVPDPERMRPSEIPRVAGDSTRLRDLTGWKPRVGVDRILTDLLEERRAFNK